MEEEKSPSLFENLLPESESILDEPALLELFTTRVEELMRDDLDLLLSSLYRLDAVSYTHLDMYKRQDLTWLDQPAQAKPIQRKPESGYRQRRR